jgi:hypothetical protein
LKNDENVLFTISSDFTYDLRDIVRELRVKNHGWDLTGLQIVGTRTLVLRDQDSRLQKLHKPWSDSGIMVAPLLIGLSEISLKNVADTLNSDGYNVDVIFGDSKSKETEDNLISSLNGQQIDILFIDGDHSLLGISSDINIYTKYVKQGGIVIFHDCGDIKSVGTDLNSFKTMRSVRSAFDDFSYGRKKLIVQEDWGLGIVWV